jgi:hypothetical protein
MKGKVILSGGFFTLLALVIFISFGLFVYAELSDSDKITVINVTGFADAKLKETGKVVTLAEGMKVGVGDEITTDSESSVELKLKDGSVVKIGPDSLVVIKELGQVEVTKVSKSAFTLVKGTIRAVVKPLIGKESKFTIESDNVTLGVRSTDFGIIFDPDLGDTTVISVEGCVSILAKHFPDLDAVEVCTNQEILVSGTDAPGAVKMVDREKLEKFLEEMGLVGGEGADDGEPPEITSAYLNNRINLEDIEDTLTLTRDDLNFEGKLTLTGTAEDEKYKISKVEVSTDGGMTWGEAFGGEIWKFEFKPDADFEYELMMRATNEPGVVSDPGDFGSYNVKYVDTTYEEIAKEFMEKFFGYVRSHDSTGIGDQITDIYDGKAGDFFTKDELLDDNIEEFFNGGHDLRVSYSINQVSFDGRSIIVSTSWTASIDGESESGTTRWWLSQSYNYTLVHTEGKWFVPSAEYLEEPKLTIELVASGDPFCDNAVKIMMVVPRVQESVKSVKVKFDAYCNPYFGREYLTLTRSFYESETGKTNGFGLKIAIFDNTTCIIPPPCPYLNPIVYSTLSSPDSSLKVYFNQYGYNLQEMITMPPMSGF